MVAAPLLVAILSALGIFHTYVFYPLLTRRAAARGCREPSPAAVGTGTWPPVTVLMAVHNEEGVLPEKLASLAAQDYRGELYFRIGSDHSADATEPILTAFAATLPPGTCDLALSRIRRGKPATVNALAAGVPDHHVLVLTDASVMLRPDTITELLRPMLAEPRIGVVDARMVHTGQHRSGISRAETTYIDSEVALKRAEGCLWGSMIGPFGGCWALRATAFRPVPANFLVDDFYLCMSAYEQGFRGVSAANAVVYEGVGQHIGDEFRRKVRISSGNWQNLVRFRKLWWPPYGSRLAYAFFSHKILRWLTPLLGILLGLSLLALGGSGSNYWALPLFKILLALPVGLALLDWLLSRFGLHIGWLRGGRYFLVMNLALLTGFIRYLKGIKSNVWQPSHRN